MFKFNFHSILSKVENFFFKRDNNNSTFLEFYRIAVAIFAAVHLLSYIRDFQKLFGKYGVIPSDIQETWTPSSDFVITLPKLITFLEGFQISEKTTITGFIFLFMVCAIFLAVGFLTRASAILLLIQQIAIINGAGLYKYGVDDFMTMSLFYLTIFPSGYYFSVDNIIFKRKSGSNYINLTPYRRLLQLHMCIVYFFSGFAKILGYNWWNGESIWKSINSLGANEYFHFNLDWLGEKPIFLVIIGWSILIIEILYPVFIWITKTRKIWLWLTIFMHISIALILNLYFFAALMIIINLTAFYFEPEKQKNSI